MNAESVAEPRPQGLRAFCVVVDYLDLFRLTYHYNKKHFSEFYVITSTADLETQRFVMNRRDSGDGKLSYYATDAFYRDGASFNKWLALEQGLDVFGRHGWICLLDADVLWPRGLRIEYPRQPDVCKMTLNGCALLPGILYSPLRRMFDDVESLVCKSCAGRGVIDTTTEANVRWRTKSPCKDCQDSVVPGHVFPPENEWVRCPIHRNVGEWAGYTQIFHSSDPVLGPPPWHQTDWKHAGGADSFFQQKWQPANKVRPPFEVLHIGNAGHNWFGRATPYLDGTVHKDSSKRLNSAMSIWDERRRRRREGLDPFEPEKIS
jgi:hypothetical protein